MEETGKSASPSKTGTASSSAPPNTASLSGTKSVQQGGWGGSSSVQYVHPQRSMQSHSQNQDFSKPPYCHGGVGPSVEEVSAGRGGGGRSGRGNQGEGHDAGRGQRPRGSWEGPGSGKGGRGRGPANAIDSLGRAMTQILRHNAVKMGLAMRADGFVAVDDLLKLSMRTRANRTLNSHTVEDVRQKLSLQMRRTSATTLARPIACLKQDQWLSIALPVKMIAPDLTHHARDSQREVGSGHWQLVWQAVAADNKQRFELREEGGVLMIRAAQGHSIESVESESLLRPLKSASDVPVCVHGTYFRNLDLIFKGGLSRMKRNHIHFATGLPKEDGVISGMRSSCDVLIFVNLAKAIDDGVRFGISSNGVVLTEGLNGVLEPKYFQKVVRVKDGTEIPIPQS